MKNIMNDANEIITFLKAISKSKGPRRTCYMQKWGIRRCESFDKTLKEEYKRRYFLPNNSFSRLKNMPFNGN